MYLSWKRFGVILFLGFACLGSFIQGTQAAPKLDELAQHPGRGPADLINAVNDLRLANGLSALSPHPALMQIAQWQADAILSGAPGHSRPPGLTLGQWMILLGYPLGGNIALDGYRSENWVGGSEMSVEGAIQAWLGDAPHTNTMLSPNRSDIGAGVAVGEDSRGKPVYYYVIETALQTRSGQQQPEALLVLTSLPQTQSASYADSTQAAAALTMPQYMIPVTVATARPDGDLIHQVKYGQALWSIAIAYEVKINDIKLLNNLSSDELWPDQKLLIQKNATQPASTGTHIPTRTPQNTAQPPTETEPAPASPQADPEPKGSSPGFSSTLVLFLLVLGLVVGLVAWLVFHDLTRSR